MIRAAYWVAVAATLGVYAVMVLWTLPEISAQTGELRPFDLRPTGYSSAEARAFLAALSDKGRALYLGPQHWLDLLYPALLAITLAGAVRALVTPKALQIALITSVMLGMAADYVENTLVARMLNETGAVPDGLIALASCATVAKSVLTGVAILAVCAGLLRAGWARWRTT
ncbi:hypothetical protein [Thalassovita taeanensis]|uniref:Uncharacterized protein n=1 Tax=Thalassovita taeanensis TaxID=657014 RepID=A0A1H9HHV3_9RHOB|nr:hypothetical protein [Thalassovita taeanensis]SEQ61940.1 hypothetical protein SAMN04488092_109130 [Thalassovita taeanensis]